MHYITLFCAFSHLLVPFFLVFVCMIDSLARFEKVTNCRSHRSHLGLLQYYRKVTGVLFSRNMNVHDEMVGYKVRITGRISPFAVCKLVARRGISISRDWIDEHGATLLHVAPSSRTSFIPTKDINAELSSERLHGHCGRPVCLAWSFPALWAFKKIRGATRCERH